jgi:hypothetical protein
VTIALEDIDEYVVKKNLAVECNNSKELIPAIDKILETDLISKEH